MIFVFGSNLAGRHGKGAALTAYQEHGADYGNGIGRMSNSYAIPTKNRELQPLALEVIRHYVSKFITYAHYNSSLDFQITRVGCGLAGYTDARIAPMFSGASNNCYFDSAWKPYLGDKHNYWGTN